MSKNQTLTYCKSFPKSSEPTLFNLTELEVFLFDYAKIFRQAKIETIETLQSGVEFNKSSWNSYLQNKYGINKRHAAGVISSAEGSLTSARECRALHIKQLKGKVKSAKNWLGKAKKKLKDAQKFYAKKNWTERQTGCRFPLSSYLDTHATNWQRLKFTIHHKTRYIEHLERQIQKLIAAPVHVKIPHNDVLVVGAKCESYGNQNCQWDGENIKFRVPKCLEDKYGKYVEAYLGNFARNINRLPEDGSQTWHFYRQGFKWVAAVQFTPKKVERVSRHSDYGCLGIDLNPSSVGWCYVAQDGNLKAHGKIPLEQGLPKGKAQAQIVKACLELARLADFYACPIVHEILDFQNKKTAFRERSKKYARMLSGWAYSQFFTTLNAICSNRGIYLIAVNPAFTSLIGLVKYARMYGLSSDVVAALAIARRGMRLSERLPRVLTARLGVNSSRHVWHGWSQLNKQIQSTTVINRRHDYYSVSNWDDVVKLKT
jgi:IS605 OrfB family transposase